MIDHQAAILNHLDSGFRQLLSYHGVADAELHPHALRFLREQIVEVWRNVLRPPEDVHYVYFRRNLCQLPINFFAEYLSHVRVVNRHGNDSESGAVHVFGNVERGLIGLGFSLDTEYRDRFCFTKQRSNALGVGDEIILPICCSQIDDRTVQ